MSADPTSPPSAGTPEPLPCPFCGCTPSRYSKAHVTCWTEGCAIAFTPATIEAWNRRAVSVPEPRAVSAQDIATLKHEVICAAADAADNGDPRGMGGGVRYDWTETEEALDRLIAALSSAPQGRNEDEDDEMWSVVNEIFCRVYGDEYEAMREAWRAWYKPEQWLWWGRGLGAFLATHPAAPQGRGEVSAEVTDKQRLDAFINGIGIYLQMCGGQGTPAAWLELGQIVRRVLRKDMGDAEWRKLAFAQHGHGADGACLYGDDGELSCSSCGADFKRMTTAELTECFVRYNLKHHGDEAAQILSALRPAPSSPETPQ